MVGGEEERGARKRDLEEGGSPLNLSLGRQFTYLHRI